METISRRGFIKRTMLVTSGSLLVPQFLKGFATNNPDESGRILIVLQLSGGNDGLNTIVPYRNDLYYKARPTLGVSAERIIQVSSELGFNPALAPLREMLDAGNMTIINNVGYPNPDRSHFRSMDIWQTASDSNEYLQTGWIGRYLDAACQQVGAHAAVEIDDTLSLAMRGEQLKGMAIKDPGKLYKATQAPFYKQVSQGHSDEPTLDYLYKTMAETESQAAYLYNKTSVTRSLQSYPNTDFAKRLKTISELIQSGVETSVYYASLSGFDTHVRQAEQQERQLGVYAAAVDSLVKDLKASGHFDRCVILTFSEFGRRVQENASGGTDHGTANNLFLMGGKLKKPGFFNQTPDLSALDQGDLIYQIDFREVYATVLQNWLKTNDNSIVTGGFGTLDFV